MVMVMGYHTLDDDGDNNGDVDDDDNINKQKGVERLFLVRYRINWLGGYQRVLHDFSLVYVDVGNWKAPPITLVSMQFCLERPCTPRSRFLGRVHDWICTGAFSPRQRTSKPKTNSNEEVATRMEIKRRKKYSRGLTWHNVVNLFRKH